MELRCEYCGETFNASRATAKYCSTSCRVSASRSKPLTAETPRGKSTVKELEKKAPLEEGWVERLNSKLRAEGLPLLTKDPEVYHFVPTGITELDDLTASVDIKGLGGFPRKRITEIVGSKGAGKTSLIKIIAENNPELKIVLFDAEGGTTSPPPNVHLVKGNVVEEIMPALVRIVQDQTADLVILDSVASLVTRKQFDEDPEGKAAMARAFGPEVKRLVAHLQPLVDGLPDPSPGVAVVFINQFRDTTQSFGKMEYTVGGRALEYYSSLRLIFRAPKSNYKVKEGKIVGQKVNVVVDKNRFGPPQTETAWILPFDKLKNMDDLYKQKIEEFLKS